MVHWGKAEAHPLSEPRFQVPHQILGFWLSGPSTIARLLCPSLMTFCTAAHMMRAESTRQAAKWRGVWGRD